MGELTRELLVFCQIILPLLFASNALLSFAQDLTTRVPEDMGMTENYDFYVLFINDEARITWGAAFANDSVHICPFIVYTPDKILFKAVTSHELVHYFNDVSHGEVIKADTLNQAESTDYAINAAFWDTPPDLKNIVYKGGDGSSVKNAINIKKAGNRYDIIKVKISTSNEIKYYCFDITKFFGEF
jgi:hypothetical protein